MLKNNEYKLHNPLHRWLLKRDVSENLLEEIRRMDQLLKNSYDKLIVLSSDEETKRIYELRETTLADEQDRNLLTTEQMKRKTVIRMIEKGFKDIGMIASLVDLPIDEVKKIINFKN